jgi:hypothetical protein
MGHREILRWPIHFAALRDRGIFHALGDAVLLVGWRRGKQDKGQLNVGESMFSAVMTAVWGGSVGGRGGVEVIGGDDLEARRARQLLVDEDDGSGSADGVIDLGSGIGVDGGADGHGSGRQHD